MVTNDIAKTLKKAPGFRRGASVVWHMFLAQGKYTAVARVKLRDTLGKRKAPGGTRKMHR